MKTFTLLEGIWVCSWACFALATALRHGLIEIAKSQVALQSQQE